VCCPSYCMDSTCRPGSAVVTSSVNVPSRLSASWHWADVVGPSQRATNSPALRRTRMCTTTHLDADRRLLNSTKLEPYLRGPIEPDPKWKRNSALSIRLQFLFVVKATASKQQKSQLYPQILSTEFSFYFYDRPQTAGIDVVAGFCAWNLRIKFWCLLFKGSGFYNKLKKEKLKPVLLI